jgi:plastocyanin
VVSAGTQVTFTNNDSVHHDMESDPHPEHTDCPEINQVGFLSPGQTRQTGNLNTKRVCGFHDHDDAQNSRWRGTITIR